MKMVKARISLEDMRALAFPIIPYQVITGNYDFSQLVVSKIKTAHGKSNLIRLLSPWAVSQKNIYYS